MFLFLSFHFYFMLNMNKDIEDNFLDAIGDVYADTKSRFRREYNRRAKQYKKKDKLKI